MFMKHWCSKCIMPVFFYITRVEHIQIKWPFCLSVYEALKGFYGWLKINISCFLINKRWICEASGWIQLLKWTFRHTMSMSKFNTRLISLQSRSFTFCCRAYTPRRQLRRLPPCSLVIAFLPFKCSSSNLQFPHLVLFTEEKIHWCPCPFRNEARGCAVLQLFKTRLKCTCFFSLCMNS